MTPIGLSRRFAETPEMKLGNESLIVIHFSYAIEEALSPR